MARLQDIFQQGSAAGLAGMKTGLETSPAGSDLLSGVGGLFSGIQAASAEKKRQEDEIRQNKINEVNDKLLQPLGQTYPQLAQAYKDKTGIDVSEFPTHALIQAPSLLTSFSTAKRPPGGGRDMTTRDIDFRLNTLDRVGFDNLTQAQQDEYEGLTALLRIRLNLKPSGKPTPGKQNSLGLNPPPGIK